jgi:hypothetical protein
MPRGAAKGRPKPAGSGRPKGSANRSTITVKSAVAKVFQDLQEESAAGIPKYEGVHLKSWAMQQPTEFYKMAAKLIPTEISGKVATTIQIVRFGDDPPAE